MTDRKSWMTPEQIAVQPEYGPQDLKDAQHLGTLEGNIANGKTPSQQRTTHSRVILLEAIRNTYFYNVWGALRGAKAIPTCDVINAQKPTTYDD